MMNFLKNFLAGDKSADEQALQAAAMIERQRDVMVIDAYGAEDDVDVEGDDEAQGSCGTPQTGCGGCGCRG